MANHIDKYVTVLFIAIAAMIIIVDIGLFGAPFFLTTVVPLAGKF